MWGHALAMNSSVELLLKTNRLVLETSEWVHPGQLVFAKNGG
jgi:hypothetical protein